MISDTNVHINELFFGIIIIMDHGIEELFLIKTFFLCTKLPTVMFHTITQKGSVIVPATEKKLKTSLDKEYYSLLRYDSVYCVARIKNLCAE